MTNYTSAAIAPTFRTCAGPTGRRLPTSDNTVLTWLAATLASHLEMPATAIDPRVPLAEMGVDSVHAVSLVGDIEVYFDIDVDPTLVFDYPTLSHIADYIGDAIAEQRVVA